MKKTWMLLSCIALLVSASAFAAKKTTAKPAKPAQQEQSNEAWIDKTDRNVSGQGYGTGGCGLGSLVFGTKPGIIQIFASTTNGTFGSQTFGITSGTSNCKPSRTAHAAELFITVNKDALVKDISRGNGESVMSLSSIVGCSNSDEFAVKLQENYKTIFPSQNASSAESSMKIINMIKADAELSKNCTLS